MTRTLTRFGVLLLALVAPAARAELPLERIRLPPGFAITVFSDRVPGARSLAIGARGTVFVGTRSQGTVYALVDADLDGRAERVLAIARGLDQPNGVAFRDGDLYVAEVSRVIRFDGIEDRLERPPAPVVVNDSFPRDTYHGWKYLRFGPDGLLYLPVGAPCNVCLRDDERYASIMRMRPDGSGPEVYARGVRNTVGFDWHPTTGELWFTDNGRDQLGDDVPPDELNRATGPRQHFGFPFLHAKSVADPSYGAGRRAEEFTLPERDLGAHVAALGMRFYRGTRFPAPYRGQVFIAEHGSWNRSVPSGYRVSLVRLQGDRAVSYEVFAEGWLPSGARQGGAAWGRPVDILELPDGSLLVSDDAAGAVYRIDYRG
jgi:glucose/arabinose dehydrogenase